MPSVRAADLATGQHPWVHATRRRVLGMQGVQTSPLSVIKTLNRPQTGDSV